MPPELVSALSTASVFILGILGWITATRTLNASKKKDAHERDEQLIARLERGAKWANDWAEQLEQKVDGYRAEQEATRKEVSSLRAKVEKLEGLLGRMASFVRHVLDRWAEAMPGIPVPHVWPDIAHLIREARHNDDADDRSPAPTDPGGSNP